MKKLLATAISVGLVFAALGAPSAEAGKKKKRYKRTATAQYQAPAIGASTPVVSGGFSGCDGETNIGCVSFATSKKDKFIKVAITDASGQNVGGFISQGDKDGDGIGDGFGTFCGRHTTPVAIDPGVPVKVSFYAGVCEDGSPSIVTSGKVKAVFTNR